jgi:NCS1 family nucleobase:cation symporter-1
MVDTANTVSTADPTEPATRTWQVETKGIDWIEDTERHGSPRRLFWPWTAANVSFFTISYGVFVVGLGLSWWQGIVAILVGMLLSYPVVGAVAVAGMRGSAPTLLLSRAAFGFHGNKLPTAFVYLSLVGWETVSVALGALATKGILVRINPALGTTPALAVGFAVTVALSVIFGVYGYEVIMSVQKWITVIVAVMTVICIILIAPKLDFSAPSTSGGFSLVLGGIALVIANGIGWTTGGADYSRYVPRGESSRSVAWWTAIGGAGAPTVLMLLGILLTAGDPKLAGQVAEDPIGAFATLLPTWFLIPFLITTVLSVVAGAVYNLYSSGLNLLTLGVRVPRWVAVGIDGVLMTIGGIYLVFVSPSFFGPLQAFLIVIGVVISGWSAVFLVDMLMYRSGGYDRAALYSPVGQYGRVNWAGVVSLVVSIVVGWGLSTSSDPDLVHVLGYFMTSASKNGALGASNVGVVAAFVVGAGLYALLSRTVFRRAPVPEAAASAATN